MKIFRNVLLLNEQVLKFNNLRINKLLLSFHMLTILENGHASHPPWLFLNQLHQGI